MEGVGLLITRIARTKEAIENSNSEDKEYFDVFDYTVGEYVGSTLNCVVSKIFKTRNNYIVFSKGRKQIRKIPIDISITEEGVTR